MAYTDCKAFFIGKVVSEEGNVVSVNFLSGKPKKGIYEWPKELCVQNVYSHQIFMDNLVPVDDPPKFLKFPTISPSDLQFQTALKNCREQLEKIEIRSSVSIYNDSAKGVFLAKYGVNFWFYYHIGRESLERHRGSTSQNW